MIDAFGKKRYVLYMNVDDHKSLLLINCNINQYNL